MSRKDYKQGMSDAMEAYQDFGEKQEAAIRHVGEQVEKAVGKVDWLDGKIGEIADYISDQERAKLYKLNTPVDIADLEDAEKRILLAVLYQLSADEDELTEHQQNYVRAVQQYLKINNPQTMIDLEAVENIEDISAQKAVLQAALEFFYLGTHPKTYSDDQMDFLDCFQVNRKTRREIAGYIEAIIEAVGMQGLSEKYGFVAEPQTSFEDTKEAFKLFEFKVSQINPYVPGTPFIERNYDLKDRVYATIEGGYDKDKCRKVAQEVIDKHVQYTKKQMDGYMSKSKTESCCTEYKKDYDDWIRVTKEAAEKLQNTNTSAILGKIYSYLLNTDLIHRKANDLSEQLASKYNIYASSYYSEIEYNDTTGGGGGFLARAVCKYGYDIGSAPDMIRDDAREMLEEFREEFKNRMQDEIHSSVISPIQKLLPQLMDALVKPLD